MRIGKSFFRIFAEWFLRTGADKGTFRNVRPVVTGSVAGRYPVSHDAGGIVPGISGKQSEPYAAVITVNGIVCIYSCRNNPFTVILRVGCLRQSDLFQIAKA